MEIPDANVLFIHMLITQPANINRVGFLTNWNGGLSSTDSVLLHFYARGGNSTLGHHFEHLLAAQCLDIHMHKLSYPTMRRQSIG